MKNRFIMKYDSFAISIVSIIYGFNLIVFPELVDSGQTYVILSTIFNSTTIGFILIVLGFLKIVAIFANIPGLRAFSISCLISIWTLFLISVLLSGVVNSVWVLSLAMVVFSFGVVIKEWFH